MYMNNGRSPGWGSFLCVGAGAALDPLELAAAGGAAVAPGGFDQLAHAVPADDRAAFLTAEEVLHLLTAEGRGVPFHSTARVTERPRASPTVLA